MRRNDRTTARAAARTTIAVEGARVHNLKNISLEIPRDRLIVVTGLSGSGKSSLAFDTIYAEGQRRYMESLSSYAKRFVAQVTKPDVDFVFGLSPVISIEQKTATSIQAALDAIDTYVSGRTAALFGPVLEYLREAGEARSASEIESHFTRNYNVGGVTTACEYLADQGIIGKASTPVHLTKKSHTEVQELAFFFIQT